MIFDLAKNFHDAVAAMPREHPKHRVLELLQQAIRYDIYFIAQHPSTVFQCLWNSCWWYDCGEAGRHYVSDKAPGADTGAEFCSLLEHWRAQKEQTTPGLRWLRSHRPPPTHLGTFQLAVLRGHEDAVENVCCSPDGLRIVSGSRDRTVRVWDATSGEELAVLRGHKEPVASVASSPDGRCVVSGSWDKTVRVWDAAGGGQLAVLREHEDAVESVAFSPNGRRIVSGSRDKTARVWDTATGEELAVLRGHEDAVESVCYSPDGRRIVSGSLDKSVRVWKASGGGELAVLRGHEDAVESVCYSPDGRCIVSGAGQLLQEYDCTVRVWDADIGTELALMRGHEGDVFCVCYSPDGRRIVSASPDNTVRVWDAPSGAELEVILGGGDPAAIAAGPPKFPFRALSCGPETLIHLVATGQPVAWLPAALGHMVTHPAGRTWAGAARDHLYIITLEGIDAL